MFLLTQIFVRVLQIVINNIKLIKYFLKMVLLTDYSQVLLTGITYSL